MANENIGDIACPLCGAPAHVRAYHSKKAGGANSAKRYIHCAECGPLMATGASAQAAIAGKAKLYETGRVPVTAAETGSTPVRSTRKKAATVAVVETAAPKPPARKTTFELDE